MSEDCPFCRKTVTEKSFANASGNIAIYNISPILEGHSLIMPGKHYKSLFEMSEYEIAGFFSFARRVTAFLCKTFDADAYDWSLQEGSDAGQSVDHLHLHIIPRKPDDLAEGEDWYSKLQQQQFTSPDNAGRSILSDAEFNKMTDRLKALWVEKQGAE